MRTNETSGMQFFPTTHATKSSKPPANSRANSRTTSQPMPQKTPGFTFQTPKGESRKKCDEMTMNE